jgi:peroxiredoxin
MAFSQSAREILQASYDKCQSITNGHYIVVDHKQGMGGTDTIASMSDCTFSKVENDPYSPALFHSLYYHRGALSARALYTGQALVHMSERDSTAVVKTTAESGEVILSGGDFNLYHFFVSPETSFIRYAINGTAASVDLLGEEIIRGKACHYLRVRLPPEPMTANLQRIEDEYFVWISKADAVPVQTIWNAAYLVYGDTLYQYQKRSLKSYELNGDPDKSLFSMSSIPDYYTVKDYTQQTWRDPLHVGIVAPNWRLPTLSGEDLSLSDQRGNVVLLDFFYNACAPCVMAFPGLQSLHKKYGDQGLQVIGINTYDQSAKAISALIAKHRVTYPVVYHGEPVAEEYLVSGYPTIYLIDRDGKIMHVKSGFGFSMEEELDALITQELARQSMPDRK